MLKQSFFRNPLFCTLLQFCAGQFLTNQLCNQCCEVVHGKKQKNQENHFFHFLAMRTRIYIYNIYYPFNIKIIILIIFI